MKEDQEGCLLNSRHLLINMLITLRIWLLNSNNPYTATNKRRLIHMRISPQIVLLFLNFVLENRTIEGKGKVFPFPNFLRK